VRESLGAVLLKIGDDAGAEEVFRADLSAIPQPALLFASSKS